MLAVWAHYAVGFAITEQTWECTLKDYGAFTQIDRRPWALDHFDWRALLQI